MKSPPKKPTAEKVNDVIIISTYAYFDDHYGELVAKRFEEYFDRGHRKFLIDLASTRLTSTLGVAILISMIELLERHNGILAFCNCNSVIQTTFTVMGLKKHSKVYPDRETALEEMVEAEDKAS